MSGPHDTDDGQELDAEDEAVEAEGAEGAEGAEADGAEAEGGGEPGGAEGAEGAEAEAEGGGEPGGAEAGGEEPAAQQPEMTRERARAERRDLDKERGEPVAGPRAGRRSVRRGGVPAGDGRRPRILVTNDDGIESRGLLALKMALDPIGDVTVVAPDLNQSAVGHLKTLSRPLRVRERTLADGSKGWSVDGSPTDCVSLACLGFFEEKFDLVASGINYGANLGDDITYSGTISAAMEAVINHLPAFGISQEYSEQVDFSLAAMAAAVVARNILRHGLRRGELLSVNVPAATVEECEGFEVTRVGRRIYQDQLIERLDPRGIPYYWIGGPAPSGIGVPGTDFNAVVNRRVSVTPIHLDLTGRRLMREMQGWDWSTAPDVPADEDLPATSEAEAQRLAEEARFERR